jgi:hypothetical protein
MPPVAGALASDRVGPIARWTPAAEILLLQLLSGAGQESKENGREETLSR